MPGVFVHRRDTHYADQPEAQYQFPRQYLPRAKQFEQDWAVYYEPVKAGGRGFYALGFVERIISDPDAANMHVACIKDYLDFPQPVPRLVDGVIVESGLSNAQAAVRPLSHQDFSAIINYGLGADEPVLPRIDLDDSSVTGVREIATAFVFEQPRIRVENLISRPFRDRVFRGAVVTAYQSRCAITGLSFINGGGRAEVEAAHIRPVEHSGPDSINNGLALSGTAHWMFDRGLLALTDDLNVLVSRHVNDRSSIDRIVAPGGRAFAPNDPTLRPDPRFLGWHRDNIFKN